MLKRILLALGIAALAAFGLAATAQANHYNGYHWERFGDNYPYGRFLMFKDYTNDGLVTWDNGIAKDGNGLYDFQKDAISGLYDANDDRYYLLPLEGDSNYYGGSLGDITIGETYQPGTNGSTQHPAWCGWPGGPYSPAQGCAFPYYSTAHGGTDNHIFYASIVLNDARVTSGGTWSPTLAGPDRKFVLCHEFGHALGLGHTGQGGHEAQPGCMDQGPYAYNVWTLGTHDKNMLAYIYGDGNGGGLHPTLNGSGAYQGTKPATGGSVYKGFKVQKVNTSVADGIVAKEPAWLKKLIKQGKVKRGVPHPVDPPMVKADPNTTGIFAGL